MAKKTKEKKSKNFSFDAPVLIVTGEHSGDLLGGDLVHAMKKLGFTKFFGTGGQVMREAGVDIVQDVDAMAVMGFVEVLRAYRRLKTLAEKLVEMAKTAGTKTAILIDYPGFNLKIAGMLHEEGIRVVYLVSPQIWAWHYSRIKKIRKNVDLMLTLFAFEEEMYSKEGVKSFWVGHPMVQRIPRKLKEESPILPSKKLTIGLLPGSRRSEVTNLLGPMLAAARRLKLKYPTARFLLPGFPSMEEYIKNALAEFPDVGVEYFTGRSLRVMEASDLVIAASGTATLETAWFEKPMVILYRVAWINFLIGGMVLRSRFVGLPNILGRKQVATELLQTEVTPDNIYHEADRILSDRELKSSIVEELGFVKRQMGRGNPAVKAAEHIHEFCLGENG